MNFYGDFPNPRTEIRQKKLFRKKKQFKDFSGSQNAQKSILGIKNSLYDYIISKTLFSEKAPQNI